MNSTPASLLERLRNPAVEQAAWEQFVQLYTPLLCQWARRLGLFGADAADLVQEIFTVLVRKLPAFHYDPSRRFRGWLWTTTVNKAREFHRRRPVAERQAEESALAEVSSPDPTQEVDEAEYRQYLVQRALDLMKADFQPTTWKAFYECVAGGRPAGEVAAELGMSIDSVYAAKSRVLHRLRCELDGLLD
jgi:RNA polymerase sigma-70 factor (ECF subfamily)